MPITPFHFGPGAALHAMAPSHISFLAFVAANVLIDVEPLYYMVTAQFPLHRTFHTYLGATAVAAAVVLLHAGGRALQSHLPDLFGWKSLGRQPVALGAAAGVYSHVALDSLMHADMHPFWPLSSANPMLDAIGLPVLHGACFMVGIVASLWLGWQRIAWPAREPKRELSHEGRPDIRRST
ncbi:hypothetical protein AACH06_28100 [Ideonella sp. DXS29W]|uniref:DUF4184 family protein n=1 Tax=Ideonella lacteola TaxID=2984193 RepID=A0ABU9BZ31_9BURK